LVEGRGAGDQPVVAGDRLVTRRRRRGNRRRVGAVTIVGRGTEGDVATGGERDGVAAHRVGERVGDRGGSGRAGGGDGGDRVRREAHGEVSRGTGVLVECRGAGDQAVVAGDRLVTGRRRGGDCRRVRPVTVVGRGTEGDVATGGEGDGVAAHGVGERVGDRG